MKALRVSFRSGAQTGRPEPTPVVTLRSIAAGTPNHVRCRGRLGLERAGDTAAPITGLPASAATTAAATGATASTTTTASPAVPASGGPSSAIGTLPPAPPAGRMIMTSSPARVVVRATQVATTGSAPTAGDRPAKPPQSAGTALAVFPLAALAQALSEPGRAPVSASGVTPTAQAAPVSAPAGFQAGTPGAGSAAGGGSGFFFFGLAALLALAAILLPRVSRVLRLFERMRTPAPFVLLLERPG